MSAYSPAMADLHTRDGAALVRKHTDRTPLIRIAAALDAYWLDGADTAARLTHADIAGWTRVVPQWPATPGDDHHEDVPENELTLWLDTANRYVITADAPWLDTIEAVWL